MTENLNQKKGAEMVFMKVDRKAFEIMQALAEAPVFKMRGQVKARLAIPGEAITTTLSSGVNETVNTANESDWVVTNPAGEQYIIPEHKFFRRYEATKEEGVYIATGYCRAIKNPFGRPIEIMAEWGEPQTGDENCLIADICDVEGNVDGEPYLIEAQAFIDTYEKAQ